MADEFEGLYVTPESLQRGAKKVPVNPAVPIGRQDEFEGMYTTPAKPPTLGEGTPRPSPYDVNERRRLRDAYAKATGEQKFEGAVRTAMNAVPIIGESWQPSNDPNMQMFQEGAPGSALGARMIGGGLPYLMTGTAPAAGRLLFGTVPRTIGTGAVVEGLDEQSRGGEFSTGAMRGASLGALSSIPGKVVTPRRTGTVRRERNEIMSRAMTAVREQHDAFVHSPTEVARVQRIISTTPPDQVSAVVNNIRNDYDIMLRRSQRQTRDWINQGIRHGFFNPERNPLPHLADLPAWMNIGGGGLLGALLAGGSHGFPAGAFAGWGLGTGAKIARNTARRIANNRRFNRYYNNQIFPDEMQQTARAAGLATHPIAEDVTEGRLGTQEILRILRGGDNAP